MKKMTNTDEPIPKKNKAQQKRDAEAAQVLGADLVFAHVQFPR